MQSAARSPTAFEVFLQRKKQTEADATGKSLESITDEMPMAPAPLCTGQPAHSMPKLPSTLRASFNTLPYSRISPAARGREREREADGQPRLGSMQHMQFGNKTQDVSGGVSGRNQDVRRSAPELAPQVLASLPPVCGAAASPSGGDVAAAVTAVKAPGSPGGASAVYGELATAAASLASAAHKLARGPAATSVDRKVAASYETLAAAAADLAASACLIRPITSSGVGYAASTAAAAGNGKDGPPQRQASLPPVAAAATSTSPARLPRAVDPTAAAAAANAGSRAVVPPGGLPSPGGAASPSAGRPGTGASVSPSRARVSAPRFPGYNPLIHLMTSDLPPPGTASAARPTTSSPITHQLDDTRPLHSSAGSTAGGSRASAHSPLRPLRGAAGPRSGGGPAPPPALLYPADLSRLPVLSLSAEGAAAAFSAGAAGGGEAVRGSQRLQVQVGGGGGDGPESQLVDPLSFLSPYADVRLAEWPPPPVTVSDLEQDELDTRYNKVLAALRERLHARGPARLAAAFRDCDAEGGGRVSVRDFLAVLQGMNLGSSGLVDDKVVSLILSGLGGDSSSLASTSQRGGPSQQQQQQRYVAYGDFVNALRFGSLPWRGYNRKLRHRVGGDPDHPFGPPALPGLAPYGQGGDDGAAPPQGTAGTTVTGVGPEASLAAKWGDLRSAFRSVDHNGDGVVEWGEFREAMARVGERHRLGLSEQEVMEVYKEADPELSRGVDYEFFMGLYGAGSNNSHDVHAVLGSSGTAAAAGAAGPLLLPEFFQPKTLRCSHADRPWPQDWRAAAALEQAKLQGPGGGEQQHQQQQQQQQQGQAGTGGVGSASGSGNHVVVAAAGSSSRGMGMGTLAVAPGGRVSFGPLSGTHADATAVLQRLSGSR